VSALIGLFGLLALAQLGSGARGGGHGDEQRPPCRAALTTVGPYRLVRCIGSGGMGTVYEAQHERLGRRFALKFLRHRGARAMARLEREARLLARLEHENIVTAVYLNVPAFEDRPEEPLIGAAVLPVSPSSLRCPTHEANTDRE